MFTGYDTGCFIFLYAKLISRNRTSKNASGGGGGGGGGGLWRPDVACNNNVTLALLVLSLTL